jgi:hypothetical protein
VRLHDRKGRAAAHEVAVVAAAGVVGLEPALELGVEVGQASEVLTVEGGPVELLERGALEALTDPRSAVDRGSGLQLGLKVQVSGLDPGENAGSS